MTIAFRCGHSLTMPREASAAPVCACGERVVSHVTGATPRFVGACSGPHAEYQQVEPDTRVLVENRLTLKTE